MISPFNGLAHLEIHWQGHLLAYLQGGLHIGDIYPCALLPTERLVRALLFESLLMTMNNELQTWVAPRFHWELPMFEDTLALTSQYIKLKKRSLCFYQFCTFFQALRHY